MIAYELKKEYFLQNPVRFCNKYLPVSTTTTIKDLKRSRQKGLIYSPKHNIINSNYSKLEAVEMKKLILLSLLGLMACSSPVSFQDGKQVSNNNTSFKVPEALKDFKVTPVDISPLPLPHTFKIKVALIRGGGDVLPGARADFNINSFKIKEVLAELERINNPGTKPDNKDFPAADQAKYDQAIKDWEEKAYKNLEDAKKIAASGFTGKSIKTDLEGLAEVSLNTGIWYISGTYKNNFSYVEWVDVPITVKRSLETFELSNDNAEVITDNK
jgi:hypothetical protein